MKGKMKYALVAALGCLIGLQGAAASVSAGAEGEAIDLFTNKNDWIFQTNQGVAGFNDERELEFIGVSSPSSGGVNTAVYTKQKFGSGKISFDFQIDFGPGVDPSDYHYGSEWLVSCFFGVLFLQNIEVNTPTPSIGIPFDIPGGYPYMLCFDTEVSGGEENRAKQLGLTLRRYKYGGSHDYTRWSTVEPTEETFTNSLGQPYESKIPDFYKPVTTEMVWDGEKHSVQLEWGNLSEANGDEKEAVKIEAWYDGEKVMTVIDEMPFIGESFGEDVEVDKRDKNGYLAFYTFHDESSPSLDNYGYKLRVSSMTIEPGKDNVPPREDDNPVDSGSQSSGGASGSESSSGGGTSEISSGGCGSVIGSTVLFVGALAAGAVGIFLKKEKKQ